MPAVEEKGTLVNTCTPSQFKDWTSSPPPVDGGGTSTLFSTTTTSVIRFSQITFSVTGTTDANGLPATSNVNVTVSAGLGAMVISPYQDQVAGGQISLSEQMPGISLATGSLFHRPGPPRAAAQSILRAFIRL